MKYRAVCPNCNHKLGREYFIKVIPELGNTCPSCGSEIKSNSLWEWVGSAILAIPVVISIGLFVLRFISGKRFFEILATTFIIGYLSFPYVTKFDLIEKKDRSDINKGE